MKILQSGPHTIPGGTRRPQVDPSTSVGGYSASAKIVHWLIALLLLIQFVVSILMPDVGPKTVPGTLLNLHFALGVTILALMAIRFAHRLIHPVSLAGSTAPRWERRAAQATHLTFYFILLIGPFLGWASASAHNLRTSVFGLLSLPDIAAPRARWALTAGDLHIYMMWTLLGLVGFHALAALYHHFIRRDGVLRRMLPIGGRAS